MVALRLRLFGSLLLVVVLPAAGQAAADGQGERAPETDRPGVEADSGWSAAFGYAVSRSALVIPPAPPPTAGAGAARELKGVRVGIEALLAPGGTLRAALVAGDSGAGTRIVYSSAYYAGALGPHMPGIALIAGYESIQAVYAGASPDQLTVSWGGPSAGISVRVPLGLGLAAHLEYLAMVGGDGAFDRPARRLREHIGGQRYGVRFTAAHAPLEIEYGALSIRASPTEAAGTWTFGSAGWRIRW